jgi:hypothetical protein
MPAASDALRDLGKGVGAGFAHLGGNHSGEGVTFVV